MKIQDIAFIVSIGILFFLKNPKLFVWFGLLCLALSMPLFANWVFFTAQRLTWYAAAFFGIYISLQLFSKRKVNA